MVGGWSHYQSSTLEEIDQMKLLGAPTPSSVDAATEITTKNGRFPAFH